MALIHEKLIAINKEVGAIGKERRNEKQNFKFRGIDDVMNELHHLFAKHEVLILPNAQSFESTERKTKEGGALFAVRATIKYIFVASDGSELSCVLIGEAMDSGDKGMNKALSIALKYALLQMFLIPTEDMKDPDAETHEVAPQPTPMRTSKLPVLTEELFNRCLATMNGTDKQKAIKAYDSATREYQISVPQKNTLDKIFEKLT